ncbi:MAG: zinc-binding dehydrogenase [bacterium]|jgi:2-desacetyl-2-hydroxyethyl bacteriochlorophyllide A dehydrogenase|nr:zinc-binding dehydrogenase [bacterium]MDD3805531.1 zinc-binding dehydrogenase [bacterium]MDD4152629.1 zinc-binding dehydrogenase [bacterium]MDD4558400.1 zinc-binding dehydrogenase [bacterium]
MSSSFKRAKAIVFERPYKATVKSIRLPAVDDETIVVKTSFSGVSLGTEMKLYRGQSIDKGSEIWYPMIPGYEQVGQIVYVGDRVRPQDAGYLPRIGDRVMANEIRYFPDYCHAWGGQVSLSIKNPTVADSVGDALAKIPDEISDEEAVAAYIPSVALKGIKRLRPADGETILVTGCGQMGLAAVQLIKIYADCRVIAMDCRHIRAERARPYADYVIDSSSTDSVEAVREITGGYGVDAVMECSGDSDIINTLNCYVKSGGWTDAEPPVRIHLQGDYPHPIILTPYQKWFVTNATITMSCANGPGHKTEVLSLIASGKLKVDFSPVYDVNDAPRAYEEIDRNYYDMVKPVFCW